MANNHIVKSPSTINIKTILGFFGIIILGAVGSGIWEYLLRPLYNISSGFILNLVTFGIQGFKDQIYLEIARNHHENSAVSILALVTAMLVSLIIVSCMSILLREQLTKYLKGINKRIDNRRTFYKIFVCVYLVLASTILLGNSVRIDYINRSITKFNQLIAVIEPHTNKNEIANINSSFALIKNKTDFDAIIIRLAQIAEINKIDISYIK